MKKFNSVKNFVVESVGYGKETVKVVENDIDRTNLNEKWSDLLPCVEIDGEVFKVRSICGHTPSFAEPINYKKGTLIGISVI